MIAGPLGGPAPFILQVSYLREVCTDPQRRCYNGVFFSSRMEWTEWADLWGERGTREEVEESMRQWQKINPKDRKYRIVENPNFTAEGQTK